MSLKDFVEKMCNEAKLNGKSIPTAEELKDMWNKVGQGPFHGPKSGQYKSTRMFTDALNKLFKE